MTCVEKCVNRQVATTIVTPDGYRFKIKLTYCATCGNVKSTTKVYDGEK